MGKTLARGQRKNNKYIVREKNRRLKEDQMFSTFSDDAPKKEKPKKKWRPRSEIDDD